MRAVGEAIVSTMFPDEQNGRIPVVAVTGVNGKTTTTRLIAHIVRQTGRHVGMTCTEGIYLDDRRLETGDCSGPQSAHKLLMNPGVDAVVLETARGGILRAGLAFDRCDVAVVTNIGEGDHLGLNDIETLDKLARVKRVPVEAVAQRRHRGAKRRRSARWRKWPKFCPGSVMFFALDPQHPVIVKHRAAGGRAVIVRDGAIVLAEGEREMPLVAARSRSAHARRPGRLPSGKRPGRGRRRLELGFHARSDPRRIGIVWPPIWITSPGRFNLLEVNGAAVVVDYGHNVSSLDGHARRARRCSRISIESPSTPLPATVAMAT